MITHFPYLLMIGVMTMNAIYSSPFSKRDKLSFAKDFPLIHRDVPWGYESLPFLTLFSPNV